MPPIELYISEDKTIFRINRRQDNLMFFTFERLTREGITELIALLRNNKNRIQKNVSLEGDNHKAPVTGARTNAVDAISGGDYLH